MSAWQYLLWESNWKNSQLTIASFFSEHSEATLHDILLLQAFWSYSTFLGLPLSFLPIVSPTLNPPWKHNKHSFDVFDTAWSQAARYDIVAMTSHPLLQDLRCINSSHHCGFSRGKIIHSGFMPFPFFSWDCKWMTMHYVMLLFFSKLICYGESAILSACFPSPRGGADLIHIHGSTQHLQHYQGEIPV